MAHHARTHDRTVDPAVDAAVEAAVAAASGADRSGRKGHVEPLVEALARLPGGEAGDDSSDPVDCALATALLGAVADTWQRGWQPSDLHRVVARRHGRAYAHLVARAIGHEARRHGDAQVPSRWRLQLDAIGGGDGATPWAVPWPPQLSADGRPAAARLQAIEVAVGTLALLRSLPRLPRLGPIPGDAAAAHPRAERRGGAGAPGADPRLLHRVTALLAKAESTNFPDEAEALTAKAQQLMTRHAIDRAHLVADSDGGPRVGGRRVGIDDPYAGARYLLLSLVADANRCRAVWTKQWGFSTVFGDEGDLDAVELLYTSLLVQATRAMVAEPSRRGGAWRRARASDTRSFRQSFLVAFAQRVGERLAQAAESVTADAATQSAALVPLFEARRDAAQAALDEAFPDVRTTRMSARNADGWHAGVRAADRAELDLHRRVRRGPVGALR
jgi:Protein of unknown function (DUF2786)